MPARMNRVSALFQHLALRLRAPLRGCLADRRGNVMLLAALAMPVMVGMLGLAVEGGNWYQTKRQLQNAADSAAIAAATNATSSYAGEAQAVASQHGFTNGVANTTVTASNAATCPGGGSNCYSVTINRSVSLMFSRLVGFSGSATVNNRRVISISSAAVAKSAITEREYCILALQTIGTPLVSNGAPNADLSGCSVMSNANATCNGHDLDAVYGDAAGTNSGCGNTQNSNVPAVADQYAALASNIPSNSCSSYPQATIHSNGKTVTSAGLAQTASGSYSATGNVSICGDLVLTGNVTLTGSQVAVFIYNGDLLTNGYTIQTASGAAATIVFTGTSGSYGHVPYTEGVIDIKAPTTGTWKGIALYQDPAITTGVDIDYAGSNPKTPVWNITGLVYLPNAAVQFSGVVNKASNGLSCFGLVIKSLLINGNGKILAQGQCNAAGLDLPENLFPTRGQLVT